MTTTCLDQGQQKLSQNICFPENSHLQQLLNVSYLGKEVDISVQVSKDCHLK